MTRRVSRGILLPSSTTPGFRTASKMAPASAFTELRQRASGDARCLLCAVLLRCLSELFRYHSKGHLPHTAIASARFLPVVERVDGIARGHAKMTRIVYSCSTSSQSSIRRSTFPLFAMVFHRLRKFSPYLPCSLLLQYWG